MGVEDDEQIIARVAALDIDKAEVVLRPATCSGWRSATCPGGHHVLDYGGLARSGSDNSSVTGREIGIGLAPVDRASCGAHVPRCRCGSASWSLACSYGSAGRVAS